MRPIKKGSTDQSTIIRIVDSNDGTPETGVDYNTSGIDLWYRREGSTKTSITEAALAALDSAHSDGGIEHIGNGYYRLDLPDAAVASGANGVMIGGGVTGMVVIGSYHPLVDYDPQDSVRMGMTALPNAAADAAGGLPISDAGGLDLDTKLANTNEVTAARMGALTDWINGGRLDLLLDAIKAVTDNMPNSGALTDIDTGVNNLETRLTAARAGYLDKLNVTGDLAHSNAAATYKADVSGLATLTVVNAIKAITDNLPNSGALTTITAYVDTLEDTLANATHGLAALKILIDTIDNFVDNEVAAIKDVTDKLDDTMEDDGGTYRFTTNALEQAPSGTGGDASESNQTTIINHLTDIKGGTFSGPTDSLEAIRDRGDSAWVTGGGGSLTQLLNVQPVLPFSIDLANTATVRLGLVLVNALDDLPSAAEITPGTITIDRKAIGGTSWTNVVNAAAMSEQAGMVYYDEVFDSSTGYAEGDSIRVTFKSISITADTNTHEVCDANGITFQTSIRQTMRGTDSAYTGTPPTVEEIQAEMEENGLSVLDTIRDDLDNATDGLGALKVLIDEITTQGDTNEGKLDIIASYIDTETTTIINHLVDVKGTGFVKDTHSLPQCLTASGFSTHSADDVKTAMEAAGSYLALIKAVTDALDNPTVAEIADAVLDEVLADLADNSLNAGQDITPRKAIRALFNRFFREVTQTASAQVVKNDASSQIATMAVSDDGTTQTKGIAT